MPDYRYIEIGGQQIYRPPSFAPKMEDVVTSEILTMSGRTIADRLGWKYADMTLSWQALPESMVQILTGINGQTTMTFDDAEHSTITEDIIRTSVVGMRHRYTQEGVTYWKEVTCDIRFVNTHIDTDEE